MPTIKLTVSGTNKEPVTTEFEVSDEQVLRIKRFFKNIEDKKQERAKKRANSITPEFIDKLKAISK
jgi:hypothetical protein